MVVGTAVDAFRARSFIDLAVGACFQTDAVWSDLRAHSLTAVADVPDESLPSAPRMEVSTAARRAAMAAAAAAAARLASHRRSGCRSGLLGAVNALLFPQASTSSTSSTPLPPFPPFPPPGRRGRLLLQGGQLDARCRRMPLPRPTSGVDDGREGVRRLRRQRAWWRPRATRRAGTCHRRASIPTRLHGRLGSTRDDDRSSSGGARTLSAARTDELVGVIASRHGGGSRRHRPLRHVGGGRLPW